MSDSTGNPLVSLIVRTKDRPKLLRKALRSISDQTYRPIEAVLVNDGGCDLNIDELKAILGDVTLKYIRLEKNTGRAHAGNVGLENTIGEYIGFLDDDDEFYPEHVETLISFLQENAFKAAYTDCEFVHIYYDTEREDYVEKDRYAFFSEDYSRELFLFRNYIPFMCILFEGETLRNIKFDSEFDLYEDWELLIRLTERNPLYHIRKITSKYGRWDDQSQITSRETFGRGSYLKVLKKYWNKLNPESLFYLYKRDSDLLWQRKENAKELSEKDREMNEYRSEISELSRKLLMLGDEVSERSREVNAQHEKINAQHEKINAQSEKINAQSEKINAQHEKINAQDREISESVAAMRHWEERSLKDNMKLATLEGYIQEIESSLSWKVIKRFRRIKEKLLPLGTGGRHSLDLLIKAIKVINDEGMRSFRIKVKRRLAQQKTVHLKMPEGKISFAQIHIQKPVDIVLPVYNGYDYLVPCIDSVINHSNLNFHRLMVIDDGSPDLRVRDFLKGLEKNNMNIEILSNHENVGFVKTVNRGMKSSDRDAILLNSDTVVTARWVEKLQRAAYSKPKIASVTPFSNNATLCSIPDFFENNSVPGGFTIDSFAEFIEEISLRHYPEIPSSVGFCNYIKRDALDAAGFFNEEHFGKGYGEECEFCARTIMKGFIHVLDDSTYIYHKGGASFTVDVKIQKEKEHLEVLDKLHPWYLPMARKFFQENPLKPIHDYTKMRIARKQSEMKKKLP